MSWDECNACLKNIQHDGKCYGKNGSIPCLIYERDPRGVKKYLDNLRFDIGFHLEIMEVGKPCDCWTISGISKTLTVTRIRKVEWHTNVKGLHGIHFWADIWYWSEENGELPPRKPKLRLVKSGG
jgi:hypothetical protein